MVITNDGSKKGPGKLLKFKCSCGCEFQAYESEKLVIPIPRYGQRDEYEGADYYARCPKPDCDNVVSVFK